jgi:hypothetical protein
MEAATAGRFRARIPVNHDPFGRECLMPGHTAELVGSMIGGMHPP